MYLLFIQETPPRIHTPNLENIENVEIYNPFPPRIDGVALPSMNRNSGFNVTELRVPIETIDSEPESSQIPRSSKDF